MGWGTESPIDNGMLNPEVVGSNPNAVVFLFYFVQPEIVNTTAGFEPQTSSNNALFLIILLNPMLISHYGGVVGSESPIDNGMLNLEVVGSNPNAVVFLFNLK